MEQNLIDLVTRASTATATVLEGLDSATAFRPTPCRPMPESEVAAHLVGGIVGFTTVAQGGALDFGADDPELAATMAGATSTTPATAFREAVAALTAAFSEPGRLDATYSMPWGPTAGSQLLGFELIEIVVHGWDLAQGLGVELPVDDDVVEATLAGARAWVDDSVRVPGMFGPEVAVDDPAAPALDRLVAFLGREPQWPRVAAAAVVA